MKATRAKIVTADQGVIDVAIEDLIAAAEIRGWKVRGFKGAFSPGQGLALREEIVGQPMFNGLHGPAYDGPGRVRYECLQTEKEYSR